MVATYDLATNVGKVRLNIGDNKVLSPVFEDDEITFFLTNNGNDLNLASAQACEAWAGKYAASVSSENMGGYSYSQNIVQKLLDMARRFRETAGVPSGPGPAVDWAEMALTETDEEVI